MTQLAIGFWGGYFGTTVLMLAGAVFVFIRSLRRVALNAALSAVASAFFVLAFLGALPIEDADMLSRFLAHVASVVAALLAYLLFSMLGLLRQREVRRRTMLALAALAATVVMSGWLMQPQQALRLSLAMACLLGLTALILSLRSALRGDRLAWVAVSGVFCMLLALAGLGWIALDRAHVPWQIHALSAIAGTAYLATMSSVLWMRYAYLIELHQVMAYGPSYDPVTRMRSHSGTANMVGAAFQHYRDEPVPLGVIVVSIANLPVLEQLYGLAAVNHALFIFTGRLRRVVPAHVEMGRLAGDGFLLLMRNCGDNGPLLQLARTVQAHLAKPVVLNTSIESALLGKQRTHWAAEVGVGVQRVSRTDARASMAVAMGRGMSRTAWTYPSRVAWYDDSSGEIVGMPEHVR
ncbi:diguanylate cyclase domain-containing protein [Polaromonas sp.]|uniref:diguanylate cyclase domain-containing protein n=1 Tax=Polaromonas sp. TaxID=1869339 RepID=UPI002FC92BC6